MKDKIELRFKKMHDDAKLPTRNNEADTGYDIYCIEDKVIPAGESSVVATGVDVAHIEEGYWFKIEARSGLGFKYSIQPHFGIIDEPYRGNTGIKLYNLSNKEYKVNKGDRIAQLVVYKRIDAVNSWSDFKTETSRDEKGFGSSGR